MPSAYEYSPDDKELRTLADNEFKAHRERHAMHWQYYIGKHPKYLKKSGSYDDNVILNIVRQSIDRTISFLIPEFPHLTLSDSNNADLENELWNVWKLNGGAVLLYNMVVNGSVDGHVYARVQYDETETIRIYNLNAANIIVYWDGDNIDDILWYELRWQSGKTAYRQDIVKDGNQWVLRDFVRRDSSNQWVLDVELVWDYPLAPIVDWQHLPLPNEFYGEHEMTALSTQNAINKTASDFSRILRFHASPKTIGTGLEPNQIQATGIDDFLATPNVDAKIFNLEMQSDLVSSMNFLNLLIQDYHNQSRVVMTSGEPDAFRGMTNLGIRATYLPMLNKNEVLRRQYGYAIQEISKRVLMLMGQEPVAPDLTWKSALPEDERENLQIVQGEIALGLMSKKTASAELGLDYTQEQDAIMDEALTADILGNGAPAGVSE